MKRHTRSASRMLVLVLVFLMAASALACSQPAPTPTPSPTSAPKSAPTKEAKPEAKDVKQATPQASAAKPAKEPAKEEKKLVKLTVPFSAISGSQAALWITKEAKLFEKYGLDVEIPYITSSTTLTQSLLSGEVKLAQGSGSAVVNANLAGADLVILSISNSVLTYSMYARPEIKTFADLKGKAVGVGGLGATLDFAARAALKKNGLEPDKDVAILSVGSSPDIMAAIVAGGVQAGVFGPPTTLQARKAGLHELLNISELGIPYLAGAIGGSKRYIASDRATTMNFMKAMVEGISVAKKDKNFAMDVIGKYSKTDDREVLDETYEYYLTKFLPKVPYATVEGVQSILDDVARRDPKAKDVKAESYIDSNFLKELEDSGFVKKLYGE
ncbi:MAG: ABC transporter substrate-binding protein [Chloroflexi bacterium]|nr:ABC transporter substrate-binding protein [Chloroflexota bacterium]